MEHFFNDCLAMLKTPEVITAAAIFGVYFAGVKTTSMLKRLCVVAVLLQLAVIISHSCGNKIPFLKTGVMDGFFPRLVAFVFLAVVLYYLMTFVAKKLTTIYKLLTD